MNSKQYAKMMKDTVEETLTTSGIYEYTSMYLSADRTEYEITLKDGSVKIVPSCFEYFED
jgi:hypothetical protein